MPPTGAEPPVLEAKTTLFVSLRAIARRGFVGTDDARDESTRANRFAHESLQSGTGDRPVGPHSTSHFRLSPVSRERFVRYRGKPINEAVVQLVLIAGPVSPPAGLCGLAILPSVPIRSETTMQPMTGPKILQQDENCKIYIYIFRSISP